MKAKYIGDPMQPTEAKNLPETFTAFGVIFERGKYAEVPDEVALKVASNPHFDTKGEEPEDTGPTEEELLDLFKSAAADRMEQMEEAHRAQIEQMQNDYGKAVDDMQNAMAEKLAAERDRADAAEAEMADLRAQLDEATKPEETKRGPGRPPKN